MASRNVLVVTGDYGVVQQVKQALGGKNFVIHSAYSHLDAVYQLKSELFELILVDAAMINRKTGERTALALTEMEKHPPLLVYSPKNNTDRWSADGVVTSLDEEALARIVTRILHLTPPGPEAPAEPKRAPAHGGISPANTTIFWRDEEMRTLFALGRSLTEVLDLSEVLNRIVEAARKLTNAEEGMILLPDGQSGQLYLRAKVGIDVQVADNFRIKTHDTIAGAVFESGQPILLGESGPQKVKTEYFVNSLLYVPIIQQGIILGVLGVNNKTKHDVFTELQRDLLINLATYAAIAIENARVHGQSIRRQHELKALVDASQVINESLSFDRALPAICQQLIQLLDVNQAEIHTWSPEKRQLYLTARYQQAVWRSGHEPILKWSERPLVRLAVETRRHNFVERDRVEKAEAERLDQAKARATLIIPIVAGEQVVGVLQAYYVNASGRGSGVANEMLLRVQRMILEMLASPSSGEDYAHSLKVLQDIKTALGADWIEYASVLPENAGLQLQLGLGGGVWVDDTYSAIQVADYPDLLEVLDKQQALNQCQGDNNLSEGGRALFRATRSRSLLALPLIDRGRAMGLVLFMDTLHSRAFTPREIDLGRTIVSQAATALQNIRLVHDLEASVSELKETQNRLVQTARLSAMGELAAAVAHQINNPLTTIVLDSELLLETEPPNTANHEVISAISRAGKRAAGVVHRLLAMARPISADSERHEVDVPYTIEDTVALVQPHIEREGIRMIVKRPTEKLPGVLAASSELNDVWLNLILNAHDAVIGRDSPEIGITSSYDAANELIEVMVWDNGFGIPDEIIGEIFKPFFTTKPEGEGTGLGLHLSRQVVERVGGTISVQTSASGTQFVVRLPIMRST